MTYVQILILAIIQGAAELLPVSSSAHVILAAKLMGEDPTSPEFVLLLVMLHTGTMFAVLFFFWPRWRRLFGAEPKARLHFIFMLILATAVTGVFGLGLKFVLEQFVSEFEKLFNRLDLIAAALASVGVLIIASGMREARSEIGAVSTASALWIGLIQGVCLPFRGFSRSGATISMALFRGIARPLAEDFSFALAVILTPPVIVRQLLKVLKQKESLTGAEVMEMLKPGLLGMLFSFLAGLIALKFLSAALEHGRWKYFGYYCIAAAGVMLWASWQGY